MANRKSLMPIIFQINDNDAYYTYLIDHLRVPEEEAITYMNNKRMDKQGNDYYYPAGYDFKECNELWSKADEAMRRLSSNIDLFEMWKDMKQIEIVTYSDEPSSKSAKLDDQAPKRDDGDIVEIKTCYKDTLFQELGWCYTENDIPDKGWGFCDSSCRVMRHRENPMQLKVESFPDIYYKMNWKIDNKKVDKDDCLPKSFRSPWQLCTKSTVPTITIARFEMMDDKTVNHIGNIQREEDDYATPLPHLKWGWQQMCAGDSGGGNWAYTSTAKKAALVGATTSVVKGWCGSPSVVNKITFPSILNWIKMHADILPQASSST